MKKDYLKLLLNKYYPLHFFALFRAHELYNVEPYINYLSEPVLDLGCGDGLIASLLFDKKLAYGIDPSESDINAARKSNSYELVIQGSAHEIPLEDNSVGGIFSNCVFEHIPDMPKLAKEISRVLKPGGYLLTTCLTPEYYELNPLFKFLNNPLTKGLRKTLIEKENILHNHVSVYSTSEYQELFEKYGLVLEEQKYYSTKNLGLKTYFLDTISKYSFSKELNHQGSYFKYLYKKYNNLQKDENIEKWHSELHNICYNKNEKNKVGTAQILLFRKK